MNPYLEHEKKVFDVDAGTFEGAMERLGAQKVFDAERHIFTFDTPDGRLRAQGRDLRLTEEGKLKLSCDVRKKEGTGNAYGIKLQVSRTQETLDLLMELGFAPVAECTARRISYEWEGIDFDLDMFEGIPPFLEIDLGESGKELGEVLALLQLTEHKVVEMCTQEVFAFYGKDYREAFKVR